MKQQYLNEQFKSKKEEFIENLVSYIFFNFEDYCYFFLSYSKLRRRFDKKKNKNKNKKRKKRKEKEMRQHEGKKSQCVKKTYIFRM